MLSGIVTLVLLVLFLVGWAWAWRPARKADFDAAARLPLGDDNAPPGGGQREGGHLDGGPREDQGRAR